MTNLCRGLSGTKYEVGHKAMNIQDIEIDAEERNMALAPTGTKPSHNGRLYKEMVVYELL